MRTRIAAAALLPLLLATVAACSSSGTTDSGTTAPTMTAPTAEPAATAEQTADPDSESAESPADSVPPEDASSPEPAAGSAVAQYCQDVDELIEEYRKVLADPTQSNAADVARKSQELAGQAADLAREAIADPSVGEQVRECSKKLENLGNAEQQ